MQQDDNYDAGPSALPGSPSDSDHDIPSDEFPPSAKLRDKLNKLANRRLDLSSIEFVDVSTEFRGSYAAVSRALLVSPSSGQDRASQSGPTEKDGLDLPDPAGEASRQRKDVAVKKMHVQDGPEDGPARILGLALREAEFLVGISHENVIKLEGFVEDVSKNVVWLVFPWAENGNLKNFIASAEWEIPERIYLIDGVARGVEYLHSQQPPIRHGDLKSINIVVNSEYRAVITDFGSARRQTTGDQDKETSHAENKPSPTLSLEPAFCGTTNTMTLTLKGDHFTLRWAAPELLYEKKATLATDIWALGCVVYEVMTNSIPFQDVEVDTAVIIRVVTGNLPSITDDARMVLIKALCSLALACWSEDPQKRPTAEDCRKSIHWMPMIRPDPIRTADAAASRARSPELLTKLGLMYRQQGDYVNAWNFFTKALGSYREVGDSKGTANVLIDLAGVHLLRGEYSQAAALNSEVLQIYSDIGDSLGRASALGGLAEVHRARNEYSQAVTFYTEALQIRTDIGDKEGRANTLQGLAEVHRFRAEYKQAVAFYSEALQIRIDIGDREGRAYNLWGLAEVYRTQEQYSKAVTFYTEALQIRIDIGDRKGRADALQGLAEVHRFQDESSQAVSFYTEALQIRADIGDQAGRGYALWGLAEVHRARKEYSQAVTFHTEALQIRTDNGDRRGRADSLWGLAAVHGARNEYSQAVTFFTEALQIRTDIDDRKGRADALLGLAQVHLMQDEYSQAVSFYTEVLQIRTDIGDRRGRVGALWGLAEVHRIQEQYSQAIQLLSEAQQIVIDIGNRAGTAFTLMCRGAVHRNQDQHEDAIRLYEQAAGIFGEIGNTSCEEGALSCAAQARQQLEPAQPE